jgi:tape measure domain-containing protein
MDHAVRQANTAVTTMQSSVDKLSNFVGEAFAIGAITLFAKSAIDAGLAMERMNSTMDAAVGNSNLAGKELQFVREQSERLGLNLVDTSLAYAKFAASAKNTSIEGEASRKIFVGVSEAVTALRLPGEQANGIFLALSQMISKGKVQAEELRGQLGERLPGAFKLAADSMGVTTAELDKMLKDGKVIASDMLPKLAQKLHETYGSAAAEAAEKGQAAINRFNNASFESKAALGEALLPALVDVLNMFRGGTPIITTFIGTFKFMVVDILSGADKLMVYMKDLKSVAIAGAVGGPIAGAVAGVAKLISGVSDKSKAELAEIDRRAQWTKDDIIKSMAKTETSVKTASELAAEAAKAAAAKAGEAIGGLSKEEQKAAKEAKKVEEDLLAQLTKQNKTFYDTVTADAKSSAELKIKMGENVLDVSLELYAKEQSALNAWYNKQAEYINSGFDNEKVKQEKLNTLYDEYGKKWETNENTKAKKVEDYSQKNLTTEASLYKTIDQYSENSVNADIAALEKKYKEYANYTKNTVALEEARAIEEKRIRLNNAAAKAGVEQNYYSTVAAWGADYYTAVEKRLNAEADLEALKVGKTFDREKWLTVKWRDEYAKRDSAAASFYGSLQNYGETSYKAEIRNIERQAQAFRDAGYEEAAVLEYVRLKSAESYIKMAKNSQDWVIGVKAGLLEVSLAHTTWGDTAKAVTLAFVNESKTQLTDNLFNALKGNFNNIGIDWQNLQDTMLKSLAKNLVDMGAEAVSKGAIKLFFETKWTEDGSNVLGIVNKVLGFAGDLLSGTTRDSAGIIGGTDAMYTLANGGFVPGYANGGNSPMNDTVRAMLSPGEFVIDRESIQAIAGQGQRGDTMLAHINPAEAALLKTLGGAGTINPRTGLPQFYGTFQKVGANERFPDGTYASTWGDWRYVSDNPANPYRYFTSPIDSMNGAVADWSKVTWKNGVAYTGGVDSMWSMNPVTGYVRLNSQEGQNPGRSLLGGLIGEEAAGYVAMAGKMLATYYGGPIGAMIATGGGELLGNAIQGNDIDFAQIGIDTAQAGATAYITKGIGEWVKGLDLSKLSTMALKFGANYAAGTAIAMAANAARGAIGGDAGGSMSVKYMGANDNGLLAGLSGLMAGIAPKSYALSAKNGLDYVPRDNFLINAHEGEAVLTKQENRERMSGGKTGSFDLPPVQVNVVVDNRVLTSIIYKQSKAGVKIMHTRGITDI